MGSVLVVGCQSNGGSGNTGASPSAMHTGSANLVCNKCGTTELTAPVIGDKGRPIPGRYRTVKHSAKATCPECARMADEGMQVGAAMHCDTCGGDVKVAEA